MARLGALVAALVAALLLAGCAAAPDAATDAAPVARSTPTPSPTATPTSTASPPPSATATPALTPSPTPSPTRKPRSPAATPSGTPPTAARARYVFPISGCRVDYGRSHHDYPATDLFAAKGCAFVSPVAGTVDEVSLADEWHSAENLGATRGGLFVSVVGVDGVRYYGAHLSSVAAGIRPGVRVRAGTLLGRVGSTGSARGTTPHLHLGLSWPTAHGRWWIRRGEVAPWPYLDSWRAGGSKSPRTAVAAKHRAVGDGACTVYC